MSTTEKILILFVIYVISYINEVSLILNGAKSHNFSY